MNAFEKILVNRWEVHRSVELRDEQVAVEEPLEVRLGGRCLVVTMRTPGQDRELIAGFLLTEGVVQNREDILEIESCKLGSNRENVWNVFLAPEVRFDFSRLQRNTYASSSCGICGKASIEAIHQQFAPISSEEMTISGERLVEIPNRLRDLQATFDKTGGLHAAGLFGLNGEEAVVREDIGRHNAVDKVLGFALLKGLLPLTNRILVVSGRASFEIMQKALAGRIPIVLAISAPSSLAVKFARESGQTLLGFVRGRAMNIYSGPERVK